MPIRTIPYVPVPTADSCQGSAGAVPSLARRGVGGEVGSPPIDARGYAETVRRLLVSFIATVVAAAACGARPASRSARKAAARATAKPPADAGDVRSTSLRTPLRDVAANITAASLQIWLRTWPRTPRGHEAPPRRGSPTSTSSPRRGTLWSFYPPQQARFTPSAPSFLPRRRKRLPLLDGVDRARLRLGSLSATGQLFRVNTANAQSPPPRPTCPPELGWTTFGWPCAAPTASDARYPFPGRTTGAPTRASAGIDLRPGQLDFIAPLSLPLRTRRFTGTGDGACFASRSTRRARARTSRRSNEQTGRW